jgi:hypothetical protein
VHLTQPDGTRIQATTEHGRFLDQVIERSAALSIPPHAGAPGAVPSGRPAGAVAPSTGRSPEPQRPAHPQDAGGSIRMEEPTPPVVLTQPDAVPLPRPSIRATPARTASRLPVTGAPAVRPKPATASGDRPPPPGVTKPRPIAPASATTAAADRAKPVADAPPSSASPAARSVAPASSCYYPGTRVPPVWDSSRSMWVEVGACEYPPAEPGLKPPDWSR